MLKTKKNESYLDKTGKILIDENLVITFINKKATKFLNIEKKKL
jgi:hypothetical protein